MSAARTVMFPKVALAMLDDLQQTCYLGAVPIAWETIGTGLVIFYSSHEPAVYVAQIFFWIAVVMTLLVTCGGVYALYQRQGQHKLDEVNGAWLLLFIPMIVAAAFGSNLANAVSLKNGSAVLVVSYLMLSLGIGCSFLVLGIYLWRLMASRLPPQATIVSTFVPVGPPSMAAYAFVNLSVALARNITLGFFTFNQSWEPAATEATRAAVAEMIMWVGVLGALFLLGFATFFLIEAVAAVATKVPKTFNIGLWSFVFPVGVYANAFCRLSILLRNEGMKGWAATCVMFTVLLWLMCALLTTYKAVLRGKLFFAPGLQGWVEEEELKKVSERKGQPKEDTLDAVQSKSGRGMTRRHPRNDGSYEPGAVNDRLPGGAA
ncbi:Plasma membrane sulfite pump involved in sulfite metabolism [Knufia obscura]|nr:Plasma membrane sulfite pump involved in sulfite metabolism [Knufia obscura]